jgi:hypothetical protein
MELSPILTYGGQATLKKGLHASDHAVIYTGKAPLMKEREKITKRAIRMIPINPKHKLDNASRLNYAKLYTIEHNVKVQFIGAVAPKYEQQVVIDYNATHQPLPDRPYYPGTSDENTFGYAQGADPGYTATAAPSPWPATPANTTYYPKASTYTPGTYSVSFTNTSQTTYPSTGEYAGHSSYTSNETYSPRQTYAVPAHDTEREGAYNPEEYEQQHTADPADETPIDNTPHHEAGLYDADE